MEDLIRRHQHSLQRLKQSQLFQRQDIISEVNETINNKINFIYNIKSSITVKLGMYNYRYQSSKW